jgi:cystathionine beta-lyase family protein involved in aluminum resistance
VVEKELVIIIAFSTSAGSLLLTLKECEYDNIALSRCSISMLISMTLQQYYNLVLIIRQCGTQQAPSLHLKDQASLIQRF